MITESRWNHILGVARKAKSLAEKMRPNDANFAQDMFLLGLLHDFGYEFVTNKEGHAVVGAAILKRSGYKYWAEVLNHTKCESNEMNDESFILKYADMTVDGFGNNCTLDERILDVVSRHGKDSVPYCQAVAIISILMSDNRCNLLKGFDF